jgi:hypothetical protein
VKLFLGNLRARELFEIHAAVVDHVEQLLVEVQRAPEIRDVELDVVSFSPGA